jgi:hypothetical protein
MPTLAEIDEGSNIGAIRMRSHRHAPARLRSYSYCVQIHLCFDVNNAGEA